MKNSRTLFALSLNIALLATSFSLHAIQISPTLRESEFILEPVIENGYFTRFEGVNGFSYRGPSKQDVVHREGNTLLPQLHTTQARNEDIKPILEESIYPYELIVATDPVGFTALHMAAKWGQLENIKTYIKIATTINKKHDLLNRKNMVGGTALDIAKLYEHADVIQYLQCTQNNDDELPINFVNSNNHIIGSTSSLKNRKSSEMYLPNSLDRIIHPEDAGLWDRLTINHIASNKWKKKVRQSLNLPSSNGRLRSEDIRLWK